MLFSSIIYGPVHSRRLGISLGINLMPTNAKVCTFNCIYCECGWNTDNKARHLTLPTVQEVYSQLETKLQELQQSNVTPDVITFSGNGEPTLHPDFESVISHTITLRDTYFPSAKISVLSNSTQLYRPDVQRALTLIDNRILKLDSAVTQTMRLIDIPNNQHLTVPQIIEYLQPFNGKFTLQTCFLRGTLNDGTIINNTTNKEIEAWLDILPQINPKDIMIYVIDRETPLKSLQKISPRKMEEIADKARQLGFKVSVSA